MNLFELVAETRSDLGKGASRRLRRVGKIPGVVYGHNTEATSITLSHDDVIHHLENEAFYSHILTLTVGDKKEKVVLKDLQRHPYKPTLMHIDLQRVSENEALTMRVPVHFANEEKCVGVKAGGIISHIMTELEISCLPKDLPEYIEVDVAELNIDEIMHLGDLKLPDGVQAASLLHGGDPAQPVVSIHAPKGGGDEEEVEEASSDEAEGE